jgi:phosphate transport system protein
VRLRHARAGLTSLMRAAFAGQLAEIEHRLDEQLTRAVQTLIEVGEAVVEITDERIEQIALDGWRLRQHSRRIDGDVVTVAARQAPVAGDLRLVMAMIQLAHHQGLIANQFGMVAEQLIAIAPDSVDRRGSAERLAVMARLAAAQLGSAASAFSSRDLALARRLDRDDDQIDVLNREIFNAALELDATREQLELAVRHVLIARSLERIGDNAVDIAELAAFVVTAEIREFSDASHPEAA